MELIMHDRMTNKEEAQLLMSWWKNYGQGIVIAVVIGLIIGFGYRYWKSHRTEQAMAASVLFQQYQAQSHMAPVQSSATLGAMKKEFSSSVFTQLAALSKASELATNKSYPQALALLKPVQAKAALPILQELASIRAARIYLQLKRPQKALGVLAQASDNSLQPVIESVQAQAYGQLGQSAKAAAMMQQAIASYKKNKLDPSLLELNAGLKH
jgi:predicted negative regulator of RcsB-dependent stress response